MAEVVRYVGPDASGAGDGTSWTDAYTSLSAWNTTEATDLVTAGDWHHVYCRSSAGSADTTAVTISGWTTGADNYILIEAADGDEAQKDGWKTDRYRLECSDSIYAMFDVRQNYVRIKGLQLKYSYTDTDGRVALVFYGVSGTCLVDGCRITADVDHYYNAVGADGGGSQTLAIQNTIIDGAGRQGIFATCGTLNVYNSIVYNCNQYGNIRIAGDADGNCIDVASFAGSAADDFRDNSSGTLTIDHCASDDGDGTNSVSPSGSDWDNEFTDPANGDFTLLNTGNLYHGGTTITGGPTYDIDGDEWDASTPSIGVDEYVSAGGTTYEVSVSDGVDFSDSPGAALTIPTSVTDGVELSDSPSGSLRISVSAEDGLSMEDSTGGAMTIPASVTDGILLSDLTSGAFTFSVTTADGIVLSDQPTEGGVISVTVADGVSFSDSAAAIKRIIATVSEGLVLSDSSSGALTIAAQVADGVTFSEVSSVAVRMLCAAEDGITLADVAVDTSVTAEGNITVSFTGRRSKITFTAKQAEINFSASRPKITFSTGD